MYQPLQLEQMLVDYQLERGRLETLARRPRAEVTRRHRFRPERPRRIPFRIAFAGLTPAGRHARKGACADC